MILLPCKTHISTLILLLALAHFGTLDAVHASVVINEIMYHPGHGPGETENLGQEYIELYNRGNATVNLGGWQFTQGIDFVFPSDIVLYAGSYLVVAADSDVFTNTYPGITNVVGNWQGRLSNSGENIELVNPTGMRIDAVTYSDQGDWSKRQLGPVDHEHRGWMWAGDHDGLGDSLELIDPDTSNGVGQNWSASIHAGGTPGTVNSVASSNIAPLIQAVTHWPIIPGPSERVTVTAHIQDELDTGITVTLHHRLDGSTGFNKVTLFDDGMHDDKAVGDRLYGGDIPALADGSIVEFYVQAIDADGHVRCWPDMADLDGTLGHAANALYQVDGSFDQGAAWVPGSQPVYRVIMRENERAELKDIGDGGDPFFGEARSNAQMNATFVSVDGLDLQVRYSAGIRNRGNRSRAQPPNNYRVNFAHDRPWKNVTALVLNSKYPHLQLIGSALYRLAGIPAPEATAVQLRLNGKNLAESDTSRMYDTYVALEAYDSDWAENHMPEDSGGNLYRATYSKRPGGGTTYAHLDYKESPGDIPDPDDYRDNYPKQTNRSQDDYTDLFGLIDALNNPDIPDANFLAEAGRVADLDQWTKYMATDAFAGNREGGLYEGEGDDYAMYRGVEDPRFRLLPHDLDTLLGQGDHSYDPDWEIFSYARLDGLRRLFGEDEIWKAYYSHFDRLGRTVFAPEHLDPLVDQLLAHWVPSSEIEGARGMKQFALERAENLLASGYDSQIPQQFTIECDLPVVGDFYGPSSRTLRAKSLYGKANAIKTSSVLVNGQSANWTQRTGEWSADWDLNLNPGINRLSVEAYDGPLGTGNPVDSGTIDIWYDDGDVSQISGLLTGHHSLDAASGPWHVTGNITVDTGATLTIEPGTTLYFNPGVGLTVKGQLQAQGRANERIRMTCVPGTETPWAGIFLDGSDQDNRLDYVDMAYAGSEAQSIKVLHARLLINHMTWANTSQVVLDVVHPQLTIQHSAFPDHGYGTALGGYGLINGEYLILRANTFGQSDSSPEVISFAECQRSGPILELYNNTFLGGETYGITLVNADAHIEGNHFTNFLSHNDTGTLSAIIASQGSHLTVTRNVFLSNDNGILLLDNSQLDATHNTFVGQRGVAIGFPETDITSGAGAHVNGTIFRDNGAAFGDIIDGATLSVNQSVMPIAWHSLGQGNMEFDPLFVDPNGSFHLKPSSGAIATGPCGLDRGAYVEPGAAICGEPKPITHQTAAFLTLGGPGITAYKYSLNDPHGPWSDEMPASIPIELTDLVNGQTYTVYVIGQNSAGLWQSEEAATMSQTWTVDQSHTDPVINEILANTDGTEPDVIELYYEGAYPLDLTGFALTDDPAKPDKFVFSTGSVSATTMNSGDYLLLFGDLDTATDNHLGFGLSSTGESLYLFGKPKTDGTRDLIDAVTFGPQIREFSIGRIGPDATWTLNIPTLGTANQVQPLGDPDQLKINEWLASGRALFDDDFVELYNPHTLPVALDGMSLTDNPVAQPGKHRIATLSFVPAEGYTVFWANNGNAPSELNFKLSANGEMIGLFDDQLNLVDQILYTSQTNDVSQGRMPNGEASYDFFELPTPGVVNVSSGVSVMTSTLVPENADKVAMIPASTEDTSTEWRSDPDFDVSNWMQCQGGPGGIGFERGSGGDYNPLITLDVEALMYNETTSCLVRIPFVVNPSELAQATGLILKMRYDDGVVAYLNGVEMVSTRRNVSGTPQWDSRASAGHEADGESWDVAIDVSEYLGALKPGKNILALHTLNQSTSSSDFVISAELDVTQATLDDDYPYLNDLDVLGGLRITELMYHAPGGGEFDYIELTNVIDTPIHLDGVRFVDGVEFEFPAWQLDPGQVLGVVSDTAAFRSEYGPTANVAGQYRGALSNSGETLLLTLAWPLEAAVLRFEYRDNWHPITDGGGQSLEIIDVTEETDLWNRAENWQAASPSPGLP